MALLPCFMLVLCLPQDLGGVRLKLPLETGSTANRNLSGGQYTSTSHTHTHTTATDDIPNEAENIHSYYGTRA